MIKINEADYLKISRDYRGTWEGKRSVFAGCIMPGGSTRLALEGVDFEIIPAPKHRPNLGHGGDVVGIMTAGECWRWLRASLSGVV